MTIAMTVAPSPFIFAIYVAQKDTTEYRCAKLIWRSTKDEKGKKVPPLHPTACIYVPHLSLSVEPQVLQSAMQESFNSIIDSMLKEYAETLLLSGKNVNLSGLSFPGGPNAFTADAVAAYFAEKEASKKLSKVVIEQFFDAEIEERLKTKLLAQNAGAISGDILAKAISEHRETLASITSYKNFSRDPALVKQLLSVTKLADSDSVIREAIIAKLSPYLVEKREIAALSLSIVDED